MLAKERKGQKGRVVEWRRSNGVARPIGELLLEMMPEGRPTREEMMLEGKT